MSAAPSLLVVCLGNICRSPMAEGALRRQLDLAGLAAVRVDSAGTGRWHVGRPPDPRAIACAAGHGVDISGQRARQLQADDYSRFDWILCADRQNLADVRTRRPDGARAGIALFTEWAGLGDAGPIPDPYTGAAPDFEQVWSLVDRAAAAVARRLQADVAPVLRD